MKNQLKADLLALFGQTNGAEFASEQLADIIDAHVTRRLQGAALSGPITIRNVTGLVDSLDEPVTGDLTGDIEGGQIG